MRDSANTFWVVTEMRNKAFLLIANTERKQSTKLSSFSIPKTERNSESEGAL